MNFPQKPNKNFNVDDLKSYLLEIQNMGLNVYSLERLNQFEIELTNTRTIKCLFSGNKCQVQLLNYQDPTNIADVVDKIQLESSVSNMIKSVLGNYPATSLSARLSSSTPASNFQSISNLLNGSNIEAVFDPYLDNSSLETLINICSFGNSIVASGVRLLSSTKKAGGTNPTFTKVGVDAFLNQQNITGEGKILLSNSEHRRFILLSGGKSLILGHSLNSIHKNEAIRIEPDTEDLKFFNEQWTSANQLN